MPTCPKCRRYLSNITAMINGNDDIVKVTGICTRHGEVEPDDWDADMFREAK